MCDKTVIKDPITPRTYRYTTLVIEFARVLYNCNTRICSSIAFVLQLEFAENL